MSNIYGPGVGRNLSSKDKQYKNVVFQPGKPPVSEEFNLLTEAMDEARKEIIRTSTPSGWISNLFDSKKDYSLDPQGSNMFWLGKETEVSYALVNGWVVPVAGTLSNDLRNAITLPPPSSNPQTHFVFLEVWKAQLSPDGTVNKPAEDQIYRYGNVEYGGMNLTNQIPDTRYKEETSERVQLQYRIRVQESPTPDTHPFGFGPGIRSQGPLIAPISTSDPDFQYQNMGDELGDSGLWRAGVPNEVSENGMSVNAFSPMNTVDGYVYALPICRVFQRGSSLWSITNQGGAFNRNPDAVDREDAQVLPTITLTADIEKDQEIFDVNTSQGATTFPAEEGRIKIGNEIIKYQSWIGSTLDATSGRGLAGTHATKHLAGAKVHHVSGNPLGLFSDEIVEDDVHDLRHVVSPSSFPYDAMLKHNFMRLAKGELKTQWKAGEGSTKGLRQFQVDHFSDSTPTPTSALQGDAPDGFRKVFSDASVLQPQNLLVVKKRATTVSSADYTFNVSTSDVYRNPVNPKNWETGDSIRIPLDSLRNTFKTVNREKVRFVHPLEYKDSSHSPVRTWFGDQTISDLEEGPEGEMIVLGSRPEGITSGLIDGTTSTITYDATNPYITIEDVSSNPVDFSSVVASLVEQEAYIILEPTGTTASVPPYKGAFKIVGDDGGQGLELELPNGEVPNFGDDSYTGNWHIRLRKCTEEDEELYMVLAMPSGELAPAEFVEEKNLFMAFDVLYHPNQGMGRVPEIPLFARLERDSGEPYVRPSGFENMAASSLDRGGGPRDYPVVPMESYPSARSETRIRNNQDVQTSAEDTWSEAYIDRGSKTVIFQPMQRADIEINIGFNPSEPDYSGGPGSDLDLDFILGNDNPCYFLPKEVLPPAGRIDIPFQPYTLTSEDVPFGLNAILTAVDAEGTLYNENIIHNRVLGIYDSQELGAADYDTYIDAVDLDIGESALGCRLYDEGGVRGIELPPHFGIARLMGAYLVNDYDGSQFTAASNYTQLRGAFTGTNVLRKDHVGRSLIITEDNTFVVPEQVLDTELIGTDLASARIVLEFATFMFNDWKADRVQVHVHNIGASDTNISLLMNGPCNANDTFMAVSSRVPYQGNMSGTMGPGFMDYRPKRQVDQVLDITNAREPLDQRDAEMRNPVAVEILATMPFVTTLGTGRISGSFKDGSYTDVGYLSQKGFPDNVVGPRVAETRTLVGESDPRQRPDVLTGLTERLPTGLLASDHLFAGEPFFGDQRSFWVEGGTDLEGFHNENKGGQLLNKNFGEGSVILSDGTNGGSATSMDYQADGDLYRTYRGGVLTVASGKQKGGPFVTSGPRLYKEFPQLRSFEAEYSSQVAQLTQGDITSQEFTDNVQELQAKYQKRLQVHGAALFGIAMLVRTRKEETDTTVFSYGDELQMLVATGASFGVDATLNQLEGEDPSREVLDLLIQMHPTGFGEGYCAADKFRLEGRPLQKESKADNTVGMDHLYRGADPAEDPDHNC